MGDGGSFSEVRKAILVMAVVVIVLLIIGIYIFNLGKDVKNLFGGENGEKTSSGVKSDDTHITITDLSPRILKQAAYSYSSTDYLAVDEPKLDSKETIRLYFDREITQSSLEPMYGHPSILALGTGMEVKEGKSEFTINPIEMFIREPQNNQDWILRRMNILDKDDDQQKIVDDNINIRFIDTKTIEISGFKPGGYYYLIRFNPGFKSKDGKPINPKLGIIKFRTE